MTSLPPAAARRNALILSVCMALANSAVTLQVTLGGLVGHILVEDKALATLPVTFVVGGTALATIPASMLMRRIGRKLGFMIGCLVAILGSSIAASGVYYANFWLFCLGAFVFGGSSAFVQLYRFAAADISPPEMKSRAISWVMVGGLVSAFLGPEIAKHTRELLSPHLFLASYMAAAALPVLVLGILTTVSIPRPTVSELKETGRPLAEIVRQPSFLVAAMAGMFGYGVMNLMMTATPLAMQICEHPFSAAATVIQWHVFGMFFPSFFTGNLIARFGALRIITVGTLLNLVCIGVALSGVEVLHFQIALFLLGVGWNFMYIGGTSLLTEVYRPAERNKTQALNDFLVFGTVALASLGSGKLLYHWGWDFVPLSALPFVLMAGLAAVWLMLQRRRQALTA
ncbi:MFS transporter [uncultured Ferrovibrio sp.]|jgi:MFS family permease|uniref:MFS transporter n=1 Tax=uncultured Ferrovibrio sp. TaxID=1576913 RepID=UPI00262D2657|nr:MFS transporter [uncultured Ferrovibrio sp.]